MCISTTWGEKIKRIIGAKEESDAGQETEKQTKGANKTGGFAALDAVRATFTFDVYRYSLHNLYKIIILSLQSSLTMYLYSSM